MAIAAAGLVTDLEAVRQPPEDAQHLLDAAHASTPNELAVLVEHADGDALGVDVESDVKHGNLLKSECVRTSTSWSHVTRLTEASFIVSRRRWLRWPMWQRPA